MPKHRKRQISRKARSLRPGCTRVFECPSEASIGCHRVKSTSVDRCSDWLRTEFSEMKDEEHLELAQYRREVMQAAGNLHRSRAQKLANLRDQRRLEEEIHSLNAQNHENETCQETMSPIRERSSVSRDGVS